MANEARGPREYHARADLPADFDRRVPTERDPREAVLDADRDTLLDNVDLLTRLDAADPLRQPGGEVERLREAVNAACEIIETGDQRLLASDGPAGGQPPDLSLAEWRTLYTTLDRARRALERVEGGSDG